MSKRLTLKERKALLARMPWITRLKAPQQCEGWKSGTPLKAIYEMGGKPPVGREKYLCKAPGYWRYKHLKRSWHQGAVEVYCWSHLMSNLHTMEEEPRLHKWLRNNGFPDAGKPIRPEETDGPAGDQRQQEAHAGAGRRQPVRVPSGD